MFAGESDGITITKNVESPVYEVEFIRARWRIRDQWGWGGTSNHKAKTPENITTMTPVLYHHKETLIFFPVSKQYYSDIGKHSDK